MHTPTKLNPFDIDKAIEELTSYRDGLKQQLEATEVMLNTMTAYRDATSPYFKMMQHNPLFQVWMKGYEELHHLMKPPK
jgi:hypothetical protein